MVITPDGIREGIDPTIKIVDMAPAVAKWEFRKFRTPVKEQVDIAYQGLSLAYDDIKIWRDFDDEENKVHIALIIKGYQENDKRYMGAGFLALDHYVGEYNVMTCVGGIEFGNTDELNPEAELIDLITLRQEIEHKFY